MGVRKKFVTQIEQVRSPQTDRYCGWVWSGKGALPISRSRWGGGVLSLAPVAGGL